ncbi:hypothetical protein ACHWQZ_G004179 [Mnemiopsis leidyi]
MFAEIFNSGTQNSTSELVDETSAEKAERKTSKRGSILTYTNKTLKQHWEEYIGNEDPHKVLNEIYTPMMIKEKEGHILCLPSNLPKKRVCLNKIRIREMNRQKTLILIRTKGSRRRGFLEHFLQQSLSLPFGYKADNLTMHINKTEDGSTTKTDTKEQVKNAIIVCCLRIFMIVCCVSMDEEFEDPDLEQKPKNVQPPVELRERVFERRHQAESDKGHQAASDKIKKSGKDNETSKKAEEGEKPKIDEDKEPVNKLKDGMSERVG